MEFTFVNSSNLSLLSKILQKLKSKYKSHSTLQKNFYNTIPKNNQIIFAIGQQNNDIKIIYQMIKQLKFTRGLQQIYHTQQLLSQVQEHQLNQFQRWLVQNTNSYKILALNSSSNNVFEPHQVYMEAKNKPSL